MANYQAQSFKVTLSDGRSKELNRPLMVGRAPGLESETEYQYLVVPDSSRSISSRHFLLAVKGDALVVVDQGSTNGTVVTLPDGQQVICAAGQEVRVPIKTTILFGESWLRIEARA